MSEGGGEEQRGCSGRPSFSCCLGQCRSLPGLQALRARTALGRRQWGFRPREQERQDRVKAGSQRHIVSCYFIGNRRGGVVYLILTMWFKVNKIEARGDDSVFQKG